MARCAPDVRWFSGSSTTSTTSCSCSTCSRSCTAPARRTRRSSSCRSARSQAGPPSAASVSSPRTSSRRSGRSGCRLRRRCSPTLRWPGTTCARTIRVRLQTALCRRSTGCRSSPQRWRASSRSCLRVRDGLSRTERQLLHVLAGGPQSSAARVRCLAGARRRAVPRRHLGLPRALGARTRRRSPGRVGGRRAGAARCCARSGERSGRARADRGGTARARRRGRPGRAARDRPLGRGHAPRARCGLALGRRAALSRRSRLNPLELFGTQSAQSRFPRVTLLRAA